MTTKNSETIAVARENLLAQIAAAEKHADAAKKAAKLAKREFRQAKEIAKEAKRVAKKLRKAVKTLKAELAALAVKTRPSKAVAPKLGVKRLRPVSRPAVDAASPVLSDVPPVTTAS
jgi:acyl-CoA reductase-like NAD-dependent aldehyde dehydrogenase